MKLTKNFEDSNETNIKLLLNFENDLIEFMDFWNTCNNPVWLIWGLHRIEIDADLLMREYAIFAVQQAVKSIPNGIYYKRALDDLKIANLYVKQKITLDKMISFRRNTGMAWGCSLKMARVSAAIACNAALDEDPYFAAYHCTKHAIRSLYSLTHDKNSIDVFMKILADRLRKVFNKLVCSRLYGYLEETGDPVEIMLPDFRTTELRYNGFRWQNDNLNHEN
jgi:hypothetical protein